MWIYPSFDLIMDIGINLIYNGDNHCPPYFDAVKPYLCSTSVIDASQILTFNNYLNFNHRSALQLNYL